MRPLFFVRSLLCAFGVILLASCRAGCQPPPPPPPANACEAMAIPGIPGPGSGVQTICTLPTDCREDTMTGLIDTALCDDKSGGSCPGQNAACAGGNCAGSVVSSGLAVPAGGCAWDRNSECKTASGAAGSNCTCKWTLAAGSSIQCGCGCK